MALSGCDYDRTGVPGIGLVRAARWVLECGCDAAALAAKASAWLGEHKAGAYSTYPFGRARLQRTIESLTASLLQLTAGFLDEQLALQDMDASQEDVERTDAALAAAYSALLKQAKLL